jgi:hypothetical protein
MFYKIEWGNGNTDVFADLADALKSYANDPEQHEFIREGGLETDVIDGANAMWSDAALAVAGLPSDHIGTFGV